MTLQVQRFDHDSPSAPTLLGGMILGAAGVSHPPLQILGGVSGVSSADGSFSDSEGYGQIDFDGAGYLYVADYSNNRIQRFVKNVITGLWQFDSKLTGIHTLLGAATATCDLVAIDRANNEIHISSTDFITASNWVSVWPVSAWPNLTTLNRLRRYGANANSNVSGRAYFGRALAVDGTHAVVSSLISPNRLLVWNHQTGVLVYEETQAAAYGRFVSDGAGNWWCIAANGAAEQGLWSINPQTFTGISRLDTASGTSAMRRARIYSTQPQSLSYHGGRLYVREVPGRLLGWTVGGTFLDSFVHPGSLGDGDVPSGLLSSVQTFSQHSRRDAVVVDQDGVPWYVAWSANAANNNTQCFLALWPMSTAGATWSKTGWSSGVNTLKSVGIFGERVAAEKIRLLARKNGGEWVTFTCAQLDDEDRWASVGTFTGNDLLELQAQVNCWDRLDGEAGSTEGKLSPSNLRLRLEYEDTAATTYVPQPTTEYQLQADAGPSYQLYLD